MKKYNLELTEKQLHAVLEATDLLQRIQLGQWTEIEKSLPLAESISYEDIQLIGEILSKYMLYGFNGIGSCLGIGNSSLPNNNGILYDLYCVIRHKLSWESAVEKGIIENENSERKWPEMIGVSYDSPMKWGDEPLAKIERIES